MHVVISLCPVEWMLCSDCSGKHTIKCEMKQTSEFPCVYQKCPHSFSTVKSDCPPPPPRGLLCWIRSHPQYFGSQITNARGLGGLEEWKSTNQNCPCHRTAKWEAGGARRGVLWQKCTMQQRSKGSQKPSKGAPIFDKLPCFILLQPRSPAAPVAKSATS